ncbi:hypothetical protein AB0P37_47845, partial [Streptomyces antimycoticus]|uniref:hypothetical protein n=1 Tax=Streptomyces antimycoticus TaxID=68175 RepID=UPI00341AFFEF
VFAAHHVVYDAASRFNLHAELTEICAAAEQGWGKLPRCALTGGDQPLGATTGKGSRRGSYLR